MTADEIHNYLTTGGAGEQRSEANKLKNVFQQALVARSHTNFRPTLLLFA